MNHSLNIYPALIFVFVVLVGITRNMSSGKYALPSVSQVGALLYPGYHLALIIKIGLFYPRGDVYILFLPVLLVFNVIVASLRISIASFLSLAFPRVARANNPRRGRKSTLAQNPAYNRIAG